MTSLPVRAFALLLFIPAGVQAQRAPAPADSVAVVSVVRALFAAAERGDLAALDSIYAGERLTVIEGAGINRGWVDYRDHHLVPEIKEMKDFRYQPLEIEAPVADDMAWVIFRYALGAELRGRAIDAVGRGTAILERSGGRWTVRHTQTSSRARRPSDSPAPWTVPDNAMTGSTPLGGAVR